MPSPMFLRRFADNVEQRPDTAAVYWRGTVLSYRALDHRARAAAEAMTAAGLRPGERLCVVAHKSPETLALLIAAWRAGHTVLLPSPELGDATLQALASRAGTRWIVRPPAPGQERDAASRAGTDARETAGLELEVSPVPGEETAPPAHGALLMLTTSGSTGMPKVVPIAPRGADNFFTWAAGAFRIGAGSRVLSYAPLNFDLSLLDVWTALAHGAQTVLVDPDSAANPERLAEIVTAGRVTVAQGVPMLFRLLADGPGRFGCVRDVIVTGDVISAPLLARLPRLFPRARVYNVYGCTETNDSTLHEVRSFAPDDGPLPIGRPIAGVHTRLVDADGTVITGPGTGELWVSTPFQSEGYLDPELTRDRFVPDPLGSDLVFYRTGDIVRRAPGGELILQGRDDFHVKVRGVRTNMAEVEHVLESHADVLEAAVVAVPDDIAGHLLHAVVRRRPGSGLTSLVLRPVCARHLPRTAIPTTITVVDHPLPRTSTGKVDRKTIADERRILVAS